MGVPARSGGGAKKTCPRAGSLAHARSLAWIEFAMPLCPSDAPHWTARNAERAARCDRPQLRRGWHIAMSIVRPRRPRRQKAACLAPEHIGRAPTPRRHCGNLWLCITTFHYSFAAFGEPRKPKPSAHRSGPGPRPALRARQMRADASPRAQGSPFLCALSEWQQNR